MSLLVDDSKLINLKFHYLEVQGKYVSNFKFIDSKEEFEQYKADPNLKELNTSWKIPTWSDHNRLYSECVKYQTSDKGVEIVNMDPVKFKETKLKLFLKQWDMKDEAGRIIPVTPALIDRLHPQVAEALLSGFEKVTEIVKPENQAV